MKVEDSVTIVAGRYLGNKGKISSVDDKTLTVITHDNTGKAVTVTLYPGHVKSDK